MHFISVQIRFSVIWNCGPLPEREFRDAIKENYYEANKFQFGLSKEQVYRLLWLFESRKVRVQKSLMGKRLIVKPQNQLQYPVREEVNQLLCTTEPSK